MSYVWKPHILVSCLIILRLTVALPSNYTNSEESTIPPRPTAPLDFPGLNQNYTFIDNPSIRANLASHSTQNAELLDLLERAPLEKHPESPSLLIDLPLPSIPEVPEKSNNADSRVEKTNVEWIENGENTEDDRVKQSNDENRGPPLETGHIAATIAGCFVIVSILAYVGLLSWRRGLEKKYGSRDILVDEDFMEPDPDDMKHFSI